MTADRRLVAELRERLAAIADPARAEGQRRYMKSTMPYYGITSPQLAPVLREVFAAHPLEDFESWRDTALALWREASHREERYAAIGLTGVRRYGVHQSPSALPMYEEMVVDGAWWDYVDEVATNRIGPLLEGYPDVVRPLMLEWSRSPDMWKRRTSIICQVGRKTSTDLDLLYACIEPNLADREFFIRKAIGWALRQYAWTDPREVAAYVERRGAELSGLSRREAVKNIAKARDA